jgi:hypothetical protein
VARPFIAEDGDGGMWTVFTDGHQLVAVRGAHEGVEPYTGKFNLRDKLLPYLSTTFGDGEEHLADFIRLAEWVGSPNVDKCPVCCGNGHTEADAGALLNTYRSKMGALYGTPINRNLLAYTFAYLRAEVLQVIVRPKAPLLFVAPTWRVLLQGCTPTNETLDTFPCQADAVAA